MMEEYSVVCGHSIVDEHGSLRYLKLVKHSTASDLSNIANTEPLHKLEIDDSGTGTNDIKFKKIALK